MNTLDLPPGVKYFTVTLQRLINLWDRIKGFDPLFSDDARWDFNRFCNKVCSRETILFELTDGNGIMFITDLHIGHYAQVHAVFFDRKLSIRINVIKDCIVWVFTVFSLVRLEAIVPEFTRALIRALTNKLSFKFEGRMRKRMKYHGRFNDLLIYSLLREETEKWEVTA